MCRAVSLRVILASVIAFVFFDYAEGKCGATEFQCENGYCVPINWLCNLMRECGDASDERHCSSTDCHPAAFQCENANCIARKWICDGADDCGDNTDEKSCERFKCHPSAFQCLNGKCIRRSKFCSDRNDCGDNSDEKYCNKRTDVECPAGWSQCPNRKRCIPSHWVCDRFPDCPGKSEEENCVSTKCSPTEFKCRNQKCINNHLICDTVNDCNDNSDEHVCVPFQCHRATFQCSNEKCISHHFVCSGLNYCGDGSDEKFCEPFHCHPSAFQCFNGKCLRRDWRCNGLNDCGDNSDELHCNETLGDEEPLDDCPPGWFQCSDHQRCVPAQWVCDGFSDCLDGSEEGTCEPFHCHPSAFQCLNGKCLRRAWRCNGLNDCGDNSDELHCNRTTPDVCPLGWFQCSDNQRCVPLQWVCDGFSDCLDGSEEGICGYETTESLISTTENMPISTTEEIPTSTTEEISIGTTEEMPIGTTEQMPISTTEEMPITEEMTISTTEEIPIGTTDQIPISTTEEMTISTTKDRPISTTEEMPIRTTEIRLISLTSIIEETTQQNVEKTSHPTVKETSENNAVEMELKSWLLRRRKPGSRTDRWGSQVHRIAVALHLADHSTFAPGNSTGEEIRYELTIQLLHRLGKEKQMESEELALYIHALLAACLDPRDFFSHDLVHELRRRVEVIGNDINPFLILVLCSSGDAMTAKDVKKVITGFESQRSPFLTDSQAIASMALSCLSSRTSVPGGDATLKYMLQTLLKYQFKKRTVENFRTTALVTQALLIEDSFENNLNFDLAMKILIDGLEGKECLLNIYYALPVFYRKSLLDVSSDHCSKQTIAEDGHLQESPEVDEATIAVHFSVWMGDEINYVRTWRLKMHSNNSVYDAIETVAKIGDVNVIEYDVVDEKPFVTAMNGKENDPELGMFWFVYVKTLKSNKDPEIMEGSPVDIKLNPNKEIILWYKSGLCGNR